MSTWDNSIFKRDYTGKDGLAYTLYYTPGSATDLSSPSTYTFPTGFISQKCDIERQFEKDVPLGIEQPIIMELVLNLEVLTGEFATGEDWSDVKESILRGISTAQRTVNGKTYYINNRWELLRSGTYIDFDGIQNYAPNETLDYDAEKKHSEYKISCVDYFHAITERMNHETLDDLTVNETKKNYMFYRANDSSHCQAIVRKSNQAIKFSLITNLYSEIVSKFNDLYSAYCRTAGMTFQFLKSSGQKAGAVTTGNATVTVASVEGYSIGQFINDGLTQNGDVAIGSPIITNLTSTTYMLAGMTVAGSGIPVGSVIVSVDSSTQITIDNNATQTTTSSLSISSFPAGTYIVSIDSATTFTVSNNAVVTGSVWVTATEIVPFIPFDLHGHYDYAQDWSLSTDNQITKSSVYLISDMTEIRTTNFQQKGVWSYLGTTLTVPSTTIYAVGDILTFYIWELAGVLTIKKTTVASITDITNLEMSDAIPKITAKDSNVTLFVQHSETVHVAGFMHSEGGLPEYDSIYDFLHNDIFSQLGKAKVNFNPSGYNLALEINKLKEPVCLTSFDNTNIKQSPKAKIQRNLNYFASVENKLSEKSDNGMDAYKISNVGNVNNNSLSLEPVFNIDLLEISGEKGANGVANYIDVNCDDFYNTLLFYKANDLYNVAEFMFKVAHKIVIDLGLGSTYSYSSSLQLMDTKIKNDFVSNWNAVINGTSTSSGKIIENAGYSLAKTISDFCNKENAPAVTVFVKNSIIDVNNVGDVITGVNLALILAQTVPTNYGTSAIITHVKADKVNDINEVTIWVF